MAKFIGKHLCESLLFSNIAGLRPAALLKKRLWHQVSSREFCQVFENTYFEEYLRTAAFTIAFRNLRNLTSMSKFDKTLRFLCTIHFFYFLCKVQEQVFNLWIRDKNSCTKVWSSHHRRCSVKKMFFKILQLS